MQSSKAGVYVFSTQLLHKIPVFELNNRFVFYRTWIVDIQSILVFLQPIHDFMSSDNTVTSSIYIFLVQLVDESEDAIWLKHSDLGSVLRIGEQVWFPWNSGRNGHECQTDKCDS